MNGPSPASPLVLIAEDEPEIAEILQAYLHRDGCRTAWARDGREALQWHLSHRPDLVLLDVQMPLLDGWQVLATLRQRGQTPVIMLTALDHPADKVAGLRFGADDYVAKPFDPVEVVARVRAVLRRAQGPGQPDALVQAGPVELDPVGMHAWLHVKGRQVPLSLTLTEFRLLLALARSPGRVFSRQELAAQAQMGEDAQDRTVDSHLSKLRKKTAEAGVPQLPASVRGVGYRLLPS